MACTRTRNREGGTRATHPYTGTYARTLHRIETRTSLLTLTHEWERGTRGQKKRGINQTSCVRECWLASLQAWPVFAYTYTRVIHRCWNRIARGERARLCGRSAVCNIRGVLQPLFGAAAVLPPTRFCRESCAYCICKATLLARTCHFPFSKSILAPCAPPAQSTTSTLLPPGLYVFRSAPLFFFRVFFFFFIYPSLSLACIRIEASNVRYSNYHRCFVVLDFVIIVMCAFDN